MTWIRPCGSHALLAYGLLLLCAARSSIFAQTPAPPPEPKPAQPADSPATQQPAPHDHAAIGRGWQFMQDGVVFGTFTRQGGGRGESEFRSQNWWMGMATRQAGRGRLTLTSMLSLEPATVGQRGYAEIFQVGETYNNLPLVDRQHPHDFLMQLAAIYRLPLGERAGLTIAAAPVGEAALGPVAFMHRASSAENPVAPLSHHTFDSTHIAMGVVTLGLDAGPLTLEGSVFQGREPDEERWDLMDPGPLDSWSARAWFRPGRWEFQISHGFLNEPEVLEPGNNARRSTASISWLRQSGDDFTAVTATVGRNQRPFSRSDAALVEATHRFGRTTIFGRAERLHLETEHLVFPRFIHLPHPGELIDPLTTATIGGVRDLFTVRGFEVGVGGDVVFYQVPQRLERTHASCASPFDTNCPRPVSFHIFFRIRMPVSSMGRMWNMTMAQPMRGHRM